jgi:hypothetical protein
MGTYQDLRRLATASSPGAAPYWPQTVANAFDPSVSGLAAAIGAIVVSVDTSKSWKKYGATDTDWIPLHVTRSTTTEEVAAVDVPMYCEQAGGFRLSWANVASTVASVRMQVRVNGTALEHAVCHAFQTREQGGSVANNINVAQLNSGAGGFAVNFGLGDVARIELECIEPKSAYGTRYIICHGTHLAASGETFGYNVRMKVPTGNIETVGLEAYQTAGAGTGRLAIGTTYRLERFA